MTMNIFLPVILLLAIAFAVVWDLKTQKIPNLLTYPMILTGMVMHGISGGWIGIADSALGMIMGIAIFIIPYLMGGMGAGDSKLMGGVGAILGAPAVVVAAVLSILFGLLYAILLMIVHRDYGRAFISRYWTTLKTFLIIRQWIPVPAGKKGKQPVLCYAVPIAIGTVCTILLKITDSNLIQQLLGIKFSI